MGALMAGQALLQNRTVRRVLRRGTVVLLKEAFLALEQGRYIVAIVKEEASDLWAEAEYRHRAGREADAATADESAPNPLVQSSKAM